MALDHRLPAIFTAICSSIAVLTAAFAGASCSFLVRKNGGEEIAGISGSFGVLCEHEIFPREGDRMWELSRIFLIVGLTLGSLTAALAWAVASFLTPTSYNWNGISVLAALTAVIQVPIFVLFEAEPCIGDLDDITVFSNQTTCSFGPGSYMLIGSDLFYIAVTVITQCFDRPRWGMDMDLWKVNKRGESRRHASTTKRSRAARNDEYYYDGHENYADDVHLTSLQARSIDDSDENEEDDYYRISRILPAGEAKKSQSNDPVAKTDAKKKSTGFFSKFLRSSSPVVDMEVQQGETHSTSGDEEYDYENQALNDLEIVRVLPQKERQTSLSPQPPSESGEGQEVSIGAYNNLVKTENNPAPRNVQSFDAVVVEESSKLIHELADNVIGPDVVVRHQMIDSPNASLIAMENQTREKAVVSSVDDILNDLHCEEMVAATPNQSMLSSFAANSAFVAQESNSPAVATSSNPTTDTVIEGVRKLTQKLKSADSKRRGKMTSNLKLNIFNSRKGGYAQINDEISSEDHDFDESTDSDSEEFFNYYNGADVKPPPGLQLLYSQENSQTKMTVNDGIQQNDIKHIYDALDQSEGYKDEDNSLLQSTQNSDRDGSGETTSDDNANPFDCISIGSTHSDPGPISLEESTDFSRLMLTSGGTENDVSTSFTDLFTTNTEDDIQWDNEFPNESLLAADNSLQHNEDSQEHSYGSSSGRNDSRRRRPSSPVGSIKSHCSLLHMAIDEETEEDVKNEVDPSFSFPLKRTLSCPEQRSFVGPISTRRDKTTTELLKKLERLKRSINVEFDPNSNSQSGRPPLSPQKAINTEQLESCGESRSSDSFTSMDEKSEADSNAEDFSAILTDLLNPEGDNSNAGARTHGSNGSKESPNGKGEDDLPFTQAGHSLQEPGSPRKSLGKESDTHGIANIDDVPATLRTNNESWRELISPMKDTPSKELTPPKGQREYSSKESLPTPKEEPWKPSSSPTNYTPSEEPWRERISPTKHALSKASILDKTVDISDETSETGYTRSTISDSDESSTGGNETGPRQIRSKSMGRAKKNKKTRVHRVSNSLSPTRRSSCTDGSRLLPANISSIARESRIRRLQLRKGYLPLENENSRAESPIRRPYAYDNADDPELTPKRKTVVSGNPIGGNESTGDSLPESLFQPSLDPDDSCPEFDNILEHLDLQLIDLNRPIGAEYGDDEGSL